MGIYPNHALVRAWMRILSIVLNRVVPVCNHVSVIGCPLRHAITGQLVGPELERDCLTPVQRPSLRQLIANNREIVAITSTDGAGP